MPANVQSYVGRLAAWHNMGDVTGKCLSTDEVLSREGFQYTIFKSQLRDGLGRPVDAWGTFRWNIADRLAGNREAAIFLGSVGKDYTVIQHEEGFKTVDALMNAQNGAFYETAGVLGKGETVWALADLGFACKVGNDVQKGFLLFVTSHDGSRSHLYKMCLERVVCENTLQVALSEKTRGQLSIRHTKNALDRLTDARKALAQMGNDVQKMEDKLNFLAGRRMVREAFTSIMDRLFPKKVKDAETGETEDTARRTNIIADILKIYELNDGNAFPEQRGTSYNLLNAITNYVDHERGTDNGRAEAAILGSGSLMKTKALDLIMAESEKLQPILVRGQNGIQVDFADLGLNIQGVRN